ncbi:MAG: hypothetical protein FWG81_01055 [Betaproteobacteria bacterium]|nr:hypothetical protein [Betaproteobacteria bacterium]
MMYFCLGCQMRLDHAYRASSAIYGGVSETVDYGAEGSPDLWRGSSNLQVGVTHYSFPFPANVFEHA